MSKKTQAVPDLANVLPATQVTPFSRLRSLTLASFLIVLVFIVGFGVWATQAPLESAAIAGGSIEAESSRKTIQHLEGGIIAQILVKDGDTVSAGQPVLRLDDTKARTALQVLQGQLWDAQAREARLMAERDERDEVTFSAALTAASQADPAVAEIVAGQRKIHDTRRRFYHSRIGVVKQRMAQTEREIVGLRAQEAAAIRRLEIIKQEIAAITPLVEKGLQTRPRLLQLEREEAEIEGRRGEKEAQISRAQQALGESEALILRLQSDSQNEIAQSLRETQTQIFQLLEKIQAATDVLARIEVRAPEAGAITDLRIHTPGGVIAAGEPLMDLVPQQDRLIVRAQVRPEDIDLVRAGLPASIRLLPYKQRRVPPIDGLLVHVSADRLVDKQTQQPYYLARLRIDEAMLRRLDGVEIIPGMPVEVLIKTGKFTVARYALSPILDSFNRAFREN